LNIEVGFMSILRFLGLWLASLCLVVLVACGSQNSTSPTTNAPNAPDPKTSSAPDSSMAGMSGMNHGKKININNAILSELDKFEAKLGVPALSNKIQASRPYGKPEELVAKNVITQAQFDQIKDQVTIEEVVLTGEAKDLDYMVKLGLMKGHMYVAKELLDLGETKQAEPHIGHPVEEIYADVEDQLKERGVKEFKAGLITLEDLVKSGAKDKAKVNAEFTKSMAAIDGAIGILPDTQRQSPKFALQVVNGLVETAKSEYGAAIADGKVKEIVEYQDSRGFITYANEILGTIATQIPPEAGKKIATVMSDLKTVWPTAVPPAVPVKTPEQVTALIKNLEMASQPIIN
jgi:Helix-hairpin-helix motif